MISKTAELYSIIRGFIERGLCGDNAREVSFKTLDAFESSLREDALQQAVIDIAKGHAEGVAEGAEQKRLKILKESFGNEGEEFVSVPVSLLKPIPTTKDEYEKMCKDAGLASLLAPTKEGEK